MTYSHVISMRKRKCIHIPMSLKRGKYEYATGDGDMTWGYEIGSGNINHLGPDVPWLPWSWDEWLLVIHVIMRIEIEWAYLVPSGKLT